MIDRIDNNNYYNTYSSVGRKKINTQDFSKSLNGELSAKNSTNKAEEANEGVKLDLSSSRNAEEETSFDNAQSKKQSDEKALPITTSITLEQIKDTILSFVNLIKDTWKTIWEDNSDNKEGKEKEQILATIEEPGIDKYGKDGKYKEQMSLKQQNSDVEKVLKSKDINQLTAMITNNGKLKLAKNSQLLTTYNRQGKIVDLDGTQKERILHGDRNLMKL